MDAFSYLSVLLSIVLGLAITQLLQGFGRLIQHRAGVRWYWPSVVWAAQLLMICIQSWWAMFGMRSLQGWTFFGFLAVIAQVTLTYLLTALVLPDVTPSADLRENYFAQRVWFFGILALAIGTSLLKDRILGGAFPRGANLSFHLLFAALAVTAAATPREWVHKAIAPFSAAAFAAYIAALFSVLA